MKNFTSAKDIDDLPLLLDLAKEVKRNPFGYKKTGENKTIGLLFFNPSLRTRLSTQKAAHNLGMHCMVMNLNNEGWSIELEDGAIMNHTSQEHIKDAAGVVSQYCDILAIRTFASLQDRHADYSEKVLSRFMKYVTVPVVSLESATLHPLQSFADLITIEEKKVTAKPRVVLSWAPHPRALPQAVANSFVQWMKMADVELCITNPIGFDLSPEFAAGVPVIHEQDLALEGADFVYAKNWSSYENYGTIGTDHADWMITSEKMKRTPLAKFMHCLPVRRNVEIADEVLDSDASLILTQAQNRTFAAQAVLLNLLRNA